MTLTAGDGVSDGDILVGWDGTSLITNNFGSAIVNVTGLGGGDAIAFKASVTGINPKLLAVQDLGSTSAAMATNITADGLYLMPAAGQLSYAKTGTASTPTVNLLLKR